jgi:hypothetical protein
VEIDRSVMAGWVGHMAALMEPLLSGLHVMCALALLSMPTIRRFPCSIPVAVGRKQVDYGRR